MTWELLHSVHHMPRLNWSRSTALPGGSVVQPKQQTDQRHTILEGIHCTVGKMRYAYGLRTRQTLSITEIRPLISAGSLTRSWGRHNINNNCPWTYAELVGTTMTGSYGSIHGCAVPSSFSERRGHWWNTIKLPMAHTLPSEGLRTAYTRRQINSIGDSTDLVLCMPYTSITTDNRAYERIPTANLTAGTPLTKYTSWKALYHLTCVGCPPTAYFQRKLKIAAVATIRSFSTWRDDLSDAFQSTTRWLSTQREVGASGLVWLTIPAVIRCLGRVVETTL